MFDDLINTARAKFWQEMPTLKLLMPLAIMVVIVGFAFTQIDWQGLINRPLRVLPTDGVLPLELDGEYIAAYAQAATWTIDFLIAIEFGLFIVVGASLKDKFSDRCRTSIVYVLILMGFFFFAFVSIYYAYHGYGQVLSQVGSKLIDVDRILAYVSMQARFLSITAVFTVFVAGLALMDCPETRRKDGAAKVNEPLQESEADKTSAQSTKDKT